MVSSSARSVEQYLADLPRDRRAALEVVRTVILENLPAGFEEGMQYGMIGYYVPLDRYAETYNGKALAIAALASQKNYMALYLMGVYGHGDTRRWFEKAYREAGKKLDMGKSCVRFRSLSDLPLEVVGQAIGRLSVDAYIAYYESIPRAARKPSRAVSRPVSAKSAGRTRVKATAGRAAPARASGTKSRPAVRK
jgi:hypothetical protein